MVKNIIWVTVGSSLFLNPVSGEAQNIESIEIQSEGIFSDELVEKVLEIENQIREEMVDANEGDINQMTVKKLAELIQEETPRRSKRSLNLNPFDLLASQALGRAGMEVCRENRFFCAEVISSAVDAKIQSEIYYIFENRIGGNKDAFRHGYWQALSTIKTNREYAKKFANAYEDDHPNESIYRQMDYFNNEVGRRIGDRFPRLYFSYIKKLLSAEIINRVGSGDFRIVKNGKLVPSS